MSSHSVLPAGALPLTPTQRSMCTGGWFALAVWLLAVVVGPDLLAHAGIVPNPHGHAYLYVHGHPFVDARAWLGIPNAMDVL
jgi:hypothetical protein